MTAKNSLSEQAFSPSSSTCLMVTPRLEFAKSFLTEVLRSRSIASAHTSNVSSNSSTDGFQRCLMTALLLQLTSVTKSFGAVRALKDVSPELRAHTGSQPGGLPDISRGLSAATPSVFVWNSNSTP